MTDPDPVRARAEAFDREAGGGAAAFKSRGGHADPDRRLKFEARCYLVRIRYLACQN